MSALTARDVAEQLGLRYEAVIKLIADGDLRAFNVSRKKAKRCTWRIESEDIAAFKDSRSNVRPTKTRQQTRMLPPVPQRY